MRIVDFGLAGGISGDGELTQSGAIMGTPRYMSPEQATCGEVDHRTDLFSVGSMLYRMTTGQCSVVGSSPAECFASLLNGNPPSAKQVNPEIPAALSSVISDLMEPDPAVRIDSAAALLERLRTLPQTDATDEHVLPATSSDGNFDVSTPRRLSSWFWGAGGLLLLGIIVITIDHKDGTTSRLEVNDSKVKSINIDLDGDKAAESVKTTVSSSQRETAQWVLDSGGKIRIETEEQPKLHAVTVLPVGDFNLVDITWPGKASPADFDRIANHGGLQFLSLTISPEFTPTDFARLSSLKSLRYLNLTIPATATQLSDDEAKIICDLSELQLLELKSPLLNGSLFQDMRRLEKFEHLSLDLPNLTDDAIQLIADSPGMYVLRIANGHHLTDLSLQHLRNSRLIQLYIQDSQITGSGFEHIANSQALAWLSVMDSPVTDASLKHLLTCSQLNHLILSNSGVTDAGAATLAQLESLSLLNLDNCQIGDAAAEKFAAAPKLTELWIRGTQITDTGLFELAKSSTLIRLSLSGPAITDAGMQHLMQSQSLRYLDHVLSAR